MNINSISSVNLKMEISEHSKLPSAKETEKTEEIIQNKSDIKDKSDISKMPLAKKEILSNINIPMIDNLKNNISSNVNKHIKEIDNILSKKNPTLELKGKEEILNILKNSQNDNSLDKLVEKLDKKGKLLPLYKDMGTLVNQSTAGGAISGVMAIFTLGGSLVAEAKENRAYEMKKILKEANISPEILNKLE